METSKLFPDGGTLNIDYTGVRDGEITYSSITNEDLEREVEIIIRTTKGSNVEVHKTVKQMGKREVFEASDGDFELVDGETFNVLKDGL